MSRHYEIRVTVSFGRQAEREEIDILEDVLRGFCCLEFEYHTSKKITYLNAVGVTDLHGGYSMNRFAEDIAKKVEQWLGKVPVRIHAFLIDDAPMEEHLFNWPEEKKG